MRDYSIIVLGLILLCAEIPFGTDMFRPYFSDYVRLNTAAAAAAIDGVKKPCGIFICFICKNKRL
jgi:hypothetical protein